MEVKITAQLPFSWCRICNRKDLRTEKMMANGKVCDSQTICENAPICEACEEARGYMKPEPDTAADDEWKEKALAMMRELDEKISMLRVIKASTDAEPWEIKGPFGIGKKDPYAEAAAIVTAWCDKNFYDSFLVTLELDGKPETCLLQYECEKDAVNVPCWDVDWWEGQTKIKVLGFRPFCEFRLYGEPSEERETT